MDDLDRLYRRLVHNIRANRPEYLQIPFTVRELYEQIIPYRHNRRELGIDTNDDYEVSVARLLSGERGYLQGDPTMQEELRRELASPTGDPGVFKGYGDSTVSLTPATGDTRTQTPVTAAVGMKTPTAPAVSPAPAVSLAADAANGITSTNPVDPVVSDQSGASVTDGPTTDTVMAPSQAAPRTPTDATATMSSAAATAAPETPVPSMLSTLSQIEVPTGCRFCGGTLPEGRDANYCPHCGENLHTKRCPACGSEMDTSWGFCVTCGRKSGQ